MLLQDLHYGWRKFLSAPGFTALALLTLALGIGANTTIFSIINSVLLRPLPYQHPDRIVQVADTGLAGFGNLTSSFPKFGFLQEHARSFSSLAAVSFASFQVTGPVPQAPVEFPGARVSADFFRMLATQPIAGRTFRPAEDLPGGDSVAVISHALWQNRFGSSASAVGATIGVDGAATTVIGVMPANFDFPQRVEIWLPRPSELNIITRTQIQNGASFLLLYARLNESVDVRQAQAEMDTLQSQYDATHRGFGDIGRRMQVSPLRDGLVSDVRGTLLLLFGAVVLVLLVAAANVGNLLLARALARQKEVAIRATLGATRSRLLIQFLAESVLLSGLGSLLGLLLAVWSLRFVVKFGAQLLPRTGEIHIDGYALGFTTAVAVFTGILFGLGPALHASRVDLNEALKATSRAVAGGGRLRSLMIVSEVALAMILLTGAGLLLKSLLRLQNVDPGFRSQNLLTLRIGLPAARYAQPAERVAFYDRILERTATLPGIRDASITSALPLSSPGIGYFFNIEGRPALTPDKAPTTWLRIVSPGYFETMGVPLLRGRLFTPGDIAGAPLVAIINQSMARHHWPDQDAIGQRVTYSRERVTVQIVGVAGNVKFAGLGVANTIDEMYVPYRQRPVLAMSLVTRTSTDPASAASALRHEILNIDPDQPISRLRTMDAVVSDSVATPRLRTALIASFAGLAVILAAIGIFGVVAWTVSQRTNEIGIRMALGAGSSNVLAMIVRQALTLIGAGQLIGLAGAFALTRVLSKFLFGISPQDPETFAAVMLLLASVGLAASTLAARRATRIDPILALRRE